MIDNILDEFKDKHVHLMNLASTEKDRNEAKLKS